MGCDNSWGHKVYRFVRFFFTQKIGEYGYGFSNAEEEEIDGDSIQIYGSTIIADAADFIRAFPQYRLEDYLYNLSAAQIQFMSIDNTHTKYLKGSDKKAWNNFKDAIKAQNKLNAFVDSLHAPKLEKGEEYIIPVKK